MRWPADIKRSQQRGEFSVTNTCALHTRLKGRVNPKGRDVFSTSTEVLWRHQWVLRLLFTPGGCQSTQNLVGTQLMFVDWLTDEWMNEFRSPEGITWEALSESVSYPTSFLAAGNETDGKPRKFWDCLSLREPSGQPARGRTVVPQVFHSFCRAFFYSSHKYPSTSWVRQLPKWTHLPPSQSLVMDVAVQSLSLSNFMNCSTPGFLVLHCLPKCAHTHVHWVDV